ncbi:MAG: sigma-70 family RNA polymerase sigma factor [Prolixibacteraceae bacterium]|nr:sigma-70 family RNA polymerase sigma factor [Prolixibacteraceae bacterium]
MFKRQSDIIISLLKGIKKDRHDCYKALFDLYSLPLYQFSLKYLKCNEYAEDIVQQVFITIWKRRKDIDTSKSFQSYLFTVALNAIRKHFNELSRSNSLKLHILADLTEDRVNSNESDELNEFITNLETFVDLMPERRREIFRKKKIECKSLKEIAEEYCISTKTVEYHLTESMKFLKKEFGKLIL